MSAMVFALSLYSVRAWVFFFVSSFRGRPPFFPRARAASSPALVRSRMMSRSNSARAAAKTTVTRSGYAEGRRPSTEKAAAEEAAMATARTARSLRIVAGGLNRKRPSARHQRHERGRVQIGPYAFSGRFFLAPLAGVSDRPFRKICRDMGAAFAYTEMVSAHGLVHGTGQTESYLDRDPEETPFAVQIFAAEPEVLARGAEAAVRHGADIVDINMACPVKKVCGTGAGAALAREPDRVRAAVEAVKAAVGVPVTVKIRAGWDEASLNCVEVAEAAEAGGASAVALHGRTRAQGYAGKARWELVGAVKHAVKVPVLGSGDVWTAADALRMARETGCDAVLVARGACGNPWIFRELAAAERGH